MKPIYYTREQIKTKKMLSGIFHLIPLYWGSLIPKWKAFLPNQVQFSRNLGFFRWFLTFIYKIFTIFFAPFVRFIVLKTFVLNTRFQRKNRFEKQPSLSRDIKEKPILFFLKYLGSDWVVFQTDFCVETVCSRRSFWVQ